MPPISLIFDIVIICIFVFFILRYAIRGFVRSLMALVKVILAPLVAVIFCTPLAKVISNAFFINWSNGVVGDWLRSTFSEEAGGYQLYKVLDGVPNWFANAVTSDLDQPTRDNLWKYFVGDVSTGEVFIAGEEEVQQFTNVIGERLSLFISVIIAFFVIFIIAEIIFVIIGALLNKMTDVTLVKGLNITLGAFIGAAFALFICMFISLGLEKLFEFGNSYYPDIFNMEYIFGRYIEEEGRYEGGTFIVKFLVNNVWEFVKLLSIR
ncbi:MAG: CvpA family protein [Clostridia bacterium]|nr:CvpA family protein [Clostridia bacterium]